MEHVTLRCHSCYRAEQVTLQHYYRHNGMIECPNGDGLMFAKSVPRIEVVGERLTSRLPSIHNCMFNKSNDDALFSILLKLAVISASSKLHSGRYGIPERHPDRCCFYWAQWDLGRELTNTLALTCRKTGFDPTSTHLWPLISPFFQRLYSECYEFERVVILKHPNVQCLLEKIRKRNIIKLGPYTLVPKELDEATGHYGECTCYRHWHLMHQDTLIHDYFVESDELAQQVVRFLYVTLELKVP